MKLKEMIMKRFLRKLLNLNIWGGRHTELKNLQKSLPDNLRGCKEAKEAIKELINKEFLNIKPSTGEKHVSLNSHKQKEIYEFIKED
jgi:multimeric flavodoxin WrbA